MTEHSSAVTCAPLRGPWQSSCSRRAGQFRDRALDHDQFVGQSSVDVDAVLVVFGEPVIVGCRVLPSGAEVLGTGQGGQGCAR